MPKERPPIPDRSLLGPYGDEEPVRERADHSALLREMVEALETTTAGLKRAVIANSDGLYDDSNICEHYAVSKAEAAIRKAREVLG